MKRGNTKLSIFIVVILLAASSVALAGDVDITGNASANGTVFEVNSTATGVSATAIYGAAVPSANFGNGGVFAGGINGVIGYATQTTTGTTNRYGGLFYAANSTYQNTGVYAQATGTATYNYGVKSNASDGTRNYSFYGVSSGTATANYGVYGNASGASTNYGVEGYATGTNSNYGVYGYAPIGTNSYAGYFNGNGAYTGSWSHVSDEKLKTDISDLNGSLEQIMELRPVVYRYRTNDNPELNLPSEYQTGLLAQDVQQVLPELVSSIAVPELEEEGDNNSNQMQNTKSYLGIDYIQLVPFLIKAIQEQQEQIAELQAIVARRK